MKRDHRDDGNASFGCVVGLIGAFLFWIFVTGVVFLIVR